MVYSAKRSIELLRRGTGQENSTFREGQEDAIQHIVEGRGRLLLVQKTGWGKSFVYFIATKLLREAGTGPALLISPLLSLMRNQIVAAERMGLQTATIHSGNKDDWENENNKISSGQIDLLLISPERLGNQEFMTETLEPIAAKISLLIIDEAHCISDWGHDFRPDYRRLERIVRTLPKNLRVLGTTATANNRVMEDLCKALGPTLRVSRGDLNRPSLRLQTIRLPQQSERMAWLADQIPTLPGQGIIYVLTIRDAVQLTSWLKSRDLNVEAYTSEIEDARRVDLEKALLENRVKALVATTALGMGFDKPDLGFVVHYQAPGSVVAYYQQVGRAGRALNAAYGVLLSGEEETNITEYFIDSAFPAREDAQQVLNALSAAPEGLSIPEMLSRLNISYGRIEKTISLLSLESPAPIVKQGKKWQLTAADLSDTFWQRADRLTALRRHEQQQMQEYVNLSCGHMAFLIQALDGDPGIIRTPDLPTLPTVVAPELIQEATAFLRRTSLPFELRKTWPYGGMPQYQAKGIIPLDLRAQPGRALCVWRDAGWGCLVYEGKYHSAHYSDKLVTACAELVREWAPNPWPKWVTCIPSRRRPDLVPDFTRRLAAVLNLPFYAALEKIVNRPEQKTMANGTQQARNVDGSFAVKRDSLPAGAVLLVDDMVDSRWTLTVAAWLLRSAGSAEIYPLALALAGRDK